jgi:hypothetical protein
LENGRNQEAKTGLPKPDSVVYLNSNTNLNAKEKSESFSLDGQLWCPFAHLHPK